VKRSSVLRGLLLLTILAAAVAALIYLPITQFLAGFADWVRSLGWWGPGVFGIVYVVACLVLPGALMTLAAGYLFGIVVGTVVVSLSSVTTASLAFWLGRTLARDWIEQKVAVSPRFRAIDQAVGEHGFQIVFLTRLSPAFPFSLLNYAFGLTKVRFRDYLLASWIGMLPGTILYVYLGSTVRELADLATGNIERPLAQKVFFWAGLTVTVLATALVTHIARNALRRAVPAGATHDSDAAGAAR
jgi:uncharacterized membrane protein YdjX (TVP38/TMEM64 family)